MTTSDQPGRRLRPSQPGRRLRPSQPVSPLTADDVPGAALLLAQRHAGIRARAPGLPAAFADPAHTQPLIAALLDTPDVIALAARRGDALAGFLVGTVTDSQLRIPIAGNAVRADATVAGALYASMAEHAVAVGARSHQVVVPADPDELDAWYGLSFGREQAYALRPVSPPDAVEAQAPARVATLDDLDAVLSLAGLVAELQNASPVYAGIDDDFFAQLRDAHAEEITNPESTYYVAEAGGAIVGLAIVAADDPSLTVPEGALELIFQVTMTDRRETGIGSALFRRVCVDAAAGGYRWIVADWRTTNQLSSRFWPARGFTPVAYRLRRVLA